MFSSILKTSIFAIAMAGVARASPLEKRDNVGDATFYDAGLGACGKVNTNSDLIVAVSASFFDTFPGYNGANPNNNPVCGRTLQATYQGKTISVKVEDRCAGCAFGDIDLTPTAFAELAALSVGRIHGVTWHLV
ncbi:plant expansin [Cyathus striatus]|nr:plant expansin [Cyathus striatus]